MSRFPSIASGMALAACLVLASNTTAQTSMTFLKDINTNPSPSTSFSNPNPSRTSTSINSQKWAMLGGWFYFQAGTDAKGVELYKSNGTKAVLVKDINKGSGSSSPSYLTVVGAKIYFRANNGIHGAELWVTDGTAVGTKLVMDIRKGSASSNPYNLVRVGAKVSFVANDGTKGAELWVSDGTVAGTALLKDIRPGASSSSIAGNTGTAVGHLVFFRANDGSNGHELWVTDGTLAGTKLLKDIGKRFISSWPSYIQTLGAGKVVFEAEDGKSGRELWVSDGTAANTRMVKDVYPGAISGTSLVNATPLGRFSGKVLFLGRDKKAGFEPWITDGTAAGTFLLKDVRPGWRSSSMFGSDTDGGKAWWVCSAAEGTYEIWRTDGTVLGTKRFSSASMSTRIPGYIAATGGKVFFSGYNVTPVTGYEICVTDGTTTTTVKDIYPGRDKSYRPNNGYPFYCSPIGKGMIAFSADDGKNGRELWISRGTAATTTMIDINPDPVPPPTANDNVGNIESLFGKLIFSATDGTDKTKGQTGQELYISDGTTAGTRLLKDIWVGLSTTFADSSHPNSMCRLGNYVYFSANDGANGWQAQGYELWRTDGTAAGTRLFKSIRPFGWSSSPMGLTRIKDKIYFSANDGINGYELWVTDGTPAGTVLVKDIYGGSRSSLPSDFAQLGRTNKAIFRAISPGKGQELWVTDGTSAGTVLVKDIYGGSGSSLPSYMRSYKGKVFFSAHTSAAGTELWVTDGTPLGTTMVKDQLPGSSSGYALHLEVQNGRLYYSGYSTKAGFEMQRSDGTTAGTDLYWDLNPGTASTWPRFITAVGSRRLYFQGNRSSTANAYDVEPIWFDVSTSSKSRFVWNVNLKGSSSPRNYRGGSGRFAVESAHVYAGARRAKVDDLQLLQIGNGATAQLIGRTQASSSMWASDPRIGKNMLLSGKTAVNNPLSVVCLGVPDGKPSGLGKLAPKSYAYFQLTKFFIIVGSVPGKAWSTSLSLPNNPGLIGMRAVLQIFALNGATFAANTEVTNGVHITIGK